MDAKSYVKNVLVTEARDFSPVVARMSQVENIRLIHASAGITSEIAELFELAAKTNNGPNTVIDRVNLMEECGDILWYIGIACDTLGCTDEVTEPSPFATKLQHDDDLNDALYSTSARLSELAGEFADLTIKKTVFYGKKVEQSSLVYLLKSVHNCVEHLLTQAGFTVEQSRERNIAKLKARYGEKFTEAAALERNLEAERKILENK